MSGAVIKGEVCEGHSERHQRKRERRESVVMYRSKKKKKRERKREREIDCNKKHLREYFCLFSH